MKAKTLTFFIGSVFLFGCGGNQRANTNVNLNANTIDANEKIVDVSREKLLVSGVGETSTQNCNGREVEFDEDSTGNNYLLRGECKKLTVNGVANKIEVEKVGEITVAGVSNKVVYGAGLDNKKPKISKTGKDTSVESRETSEKNKKLQEQKEAKEAAKSK